MKIKFVIIVSIIVLIISLSVFADVPENKVLVYPVYPDITQNTDYSVSVSQGEDNYPLTVYNPMSSKGRTESDDYRRFCEFDFSGDAVTINITINKSFTSYEVLPSALGLPSTINGNTVSVTLTKPQDFLIRLDRDDNTILSIFSSEIETDIPTEGTPNLFYYKAGWHDVEGATLTLTDNQSLYLAPGAVLNARINVIGNNVKIYGRGMIRDGLRKTEDTTSTMIFVKQGCDGTTIKDIKIIDSYWYNIAVKWTTSNTSIDRVRILSNQVSTDGIVLSGGMKYARVRNCFIYNADNVFVLANDKPSYNEISNCIIGSTCSILFPQSNLDAEFTIKDLYVFRCYGSTDHRHALIRHTYKGTEESYIPGTTIENIDASDCTAIRHLFYTDYIGGDQSRKLILKNIIIPWPSIDEFGKKYGIEIKPGSGNYHLILDNVKFGSTLLTNNKQTIVVDNGTPKSTIEYKNSFYGDINMNGETEATDSTLLLQYLAGWDVKVSRFANLDFNGDGTVSAIDATDLMQYLAGWGA